MSESHYLLPSWVSDPVDPAAVTPALLEKWRDESAACLRQNQSIFSQLRAQQLELIQRAVALYGEKSRAVRALRREEVSQPPSFDFERLEARIQGAWRSRPRDEPVGDAYAQRALTWLQRRGIDADLDTAIERADEQAWGEEIERLCDRYKWVTFEGGVDCNPECIGWDGASKHCECGAHTVTWHVGSSHSFLQPNVRAVAHG